MPVMIDAVHAIAYCEMRIANCQKHIDEINTEYENATIIYEGKFFPRLFGWKFKDSMTGSWGWDGSWGYMGYDSAKYTYTEFLTKAEYFEKMKEKVEIPERLEIGFFRYCKENNIPY